MIVIVGLVILVASVLIGLVGVLANGGNAHALTDNFAVFGYHVTGSTGLLFLYGIAVGAAGLAGLAILLGGARRTARRGAATRAELVASRRELAASGSGTPDTPTRYTHTGTTDATVPGTPAGNPNQEPR